VCLHDCHPYDLIHIIVAVGCERPEERVLGFLFRVLAVAVRDIFIRRQPLEGGGGEFGGFASPLLLRLAIEECLVESATEKPQGLLLEVLRILDRRVRLGSDKRSGLLGRSLPPKI
jgi:hypothetical protein